MTDVEIEGFDISDRGVFSSSTLYDSARRLGLDVGLRGVLPIAGGKRLVARAYTLKFAPPEPPPAQKINFYDVLGAAPKGSVLMVEAGGDHWICGSNTTRFAELSGLSGVVVDACVRDFAAIAERSFPVFARGPAVTGFGGQLVMAAAGEPITCGGVTVSAGDLVVGDEDGLVALPAARLAEILYEAEDIASLDAQLERAIEERQPLTVIHETRLKWWTRRNP
jgi:regulator of RNase E activity RraA